MNTSITSTRGKPNTIAMLYDALENALCSTKGELTIELNNVRYPLKAGEGILIFPNETYTLKTVGLAEKVSCLYAKDFIKDFDEAVQDDVEILNRQFVFDSSILPEGRKDPRTSPKTTNLPPHIFKK